MLTNVVPSFCGGNFHSTLVRPLYPSHSMSIRLFGSIAFTATSVDAPYNSHSHFTCLPISSRPLLLVNQNLVVMLGSMKAANTAATGLRINIPVLATGACLNWGLF